MDDKYKERLKLIKEEVMKEARFFCDQLDCFDESFPVGLTHKTKNKIKGFTILIDVIDYCEADDVDTTYGDTVNEHCLQLRKAGEKQARKGAKRLMEFDT